MTSIAQRAASKDEDGESFFTRAQQ